MHVRFFFCFEVVFVDQICFGGSGCLFLLISRGGVGGGGGLLTGLFAFVQCLFFVDQLVFVVGCFCWWGFCWKLFVFVVVLFLLAGLFLFMGFVFVDGVVCFCGGLVGRVVCFCLWGCLFLFVGLFCRGGCFFLFISSRVCKILCACMTVCFCCVFVGEVVFVLQVYFVGKVLHIMCVLFCWSGCSFQPGIFVS